MTGNNKYSPLRWIVEGAGKEKYAIVLLLILQVLLSVFALGQVFALRTVVDEAIQGQRARFQLALIVLAGLIVLQIIGRFLNQLLDEVVRSGLEISFKERLFQTLLNKDFSEVMAVHVGEWLNRLTSDASTVANSMAHILPGTAGLLVKLLGSVLLLSALDWRFGFLVLGGGIPLIIVTWLFRKIMKRLHKQVQEADGKLRIFLQEHISNMLVVHSFAQEENVQKQAKEKMDVFHVKRVRRTAFSAAAHSSFGIIMNGVYLMAVIYCGYGILNQRVTYGTFTAILSLVAQIQAPLANMSGYLSQYYNMLASAERLMEAEKMADCAFDTVDDWSAIGLSQVDFSYDLMEDGQKIPQPVTLSDLTLEIQRGESVAFVGPSGCGKSTVLKLLMGLYVPDRGERYYRLGEKKTVVNALLRSMFAYVPQGNRLVSGTIREIICFGDAEKMKQEDKIWTALEIADAAEFVREKEKGLDTELGEQGSGLSEGQIQRLAIARAVFSDYPILLLDEATSSLDEQTEQQVLEKLKELTEKTVVIVTHRPAALSIVDKVIDFGSMGGKKDNEI